MKWIWMILLLTLLGGGLIWATRRRSRTDLETRIARDLKSYEQKQSTEDRERIMVIVRPLGDETFGRTQRRQNIVPAKVTLDTNASDEAPLVDLFVGNLSLRYALDGEQLMLNLTPSLLKSLSLERNELLALGVKNLHLRYPNAKVHRSEGFGMVTGAGDLESSWLLDFAFWKEESKRFSGPLVASVPSREVMVWCDSANSELVAEVKKKGEDIAIKEAASNRAISSLLYVWREDHWEVY